MYQILCGRDAVFSDSAAARRAHKTICRICQMDADASAGHIIRGIQHKMQGKDCAASYRADSNCSGKTDHSSGKDVIVTKME